MIISTNSTTVERQERISDLISATKHNYQTLLMLLYEDVKLTCKSNQYILRDFQLKLKDVSVWSDQRKQEESNRFDLHTIQSILNDIVRMNYTLFGTGSDLKQVRSIDFIYSNILNVAREVWTKPFLLYHRVNKQEYQKNILALEKLIIGEIKASVRRIDKLDYVSRPNTTPISIPPPTQTLVETSSHEHDEKPLDMKNQQVVQLKEIFSEVIKDDELNISNCSTIDDLIKHTSSDLSIQSDSDSMASSIPKQKVKRRGSLKKFIAKNNQTYKNRYRDYLNPYVYAPRK